jgi:hypothetical protein
MRYEEVTDLIAFLGVAEESNFARATALLPQLSARPRGSL